MSVARDGVHAEFLCVGFRAHKSDAIDCDQTNLDHLTKCSRGCAAASERYMLPLNTYKSQNGEACRMHSVPDQSEVHKGLSKGRQGTW